VLALHTYIWLDKFFDLAEMWKDVAKRRYITVGFTAFVLLIPLAITSTTAGFAASAAAAGSNCTAPSTSAPSVV